MVVFLLVSLKKKKGYPQTRQIHFVYSFSYPQVSLPSTFTLEAYRWRLHVSGPSGETSIQGARKDASMFGDGSPTRT